MSPEQGERSNDEPIEPALLRLMEEFTERARRGERPTIEEYAAANPSLAASIRDLFPPILLVEKSQRGSPPAVSAVAPVRPDGGSLGRSRPGGYRIVREIGRGGMGIVYEAMQESLGRRVALKLLPGGMLQEPRRLARFEREARAAATLQHPNIVPVHDVGEDGGDRYYVMQFIEGEGLDRAIAEVRRKRGELDSAAGQGPAEVAATPRPPGATPDIPLRDRFSAAARLGIQVADALAYAHGQGIIHRDIKPSNLLLDREGKVWITDFGLAKSEGSDHLTGSGEVVGTLLYMAPERFKGWSDPRSDVYSLGLVLYEILTLESAFADEDRSRVIMRILEEEPRRPRRIERSVPRDLETIVLKAISKEPGSRYPDAAALAGDLRRFLAGEPIEARQSGALHRCAKWARRRPASAALAAVSAFAVAVVLAGTLWHNAALRQEARRTRANLEKALQAVETMLLRVGDERLAMVPGMEPVRRRLLEDAQNQYDELLAEYPSDDSVRLGAARTYARAAQVQGIAGLRAEGRAALRRSLDILEALARGSPTNEACRKELEAVRSIERLFDAPERPPNWARVSRFHLDGVTNTVDVAAADLDGDGKPDLAVAGRFSHNLVILRNAGERQFAASAPCETGRGPYNVLACDVDGDGKQDVLTADQSDKDVSWFRGRGDGSVETRRSCPLDFRPHHLAAADLDGDGKVELAIAGDAAAIAKWAPGDKFVLERIPGEANAISVVAADFDRDGHTDLAFGCNLNPDQISVRWNDGKGGFLSPPTIIAPGWLNTLFAGDIDEDGRIDLISIGANEGGVSVSLNAGRRSFREGNKFKYRPGQWGVGLADTDGDRHLDLVLSSESEGIVSVLFGDGTGLFPDAVRFETGGGAFAGDIADLDGDGSLDIAVSNGMANDVAVLFRARDLSSMRQATDQATSLPAILLQQQGGVYLAGASLTLRVEARGRDLTYRWTKDGRPYDGSTSTLSFPGLKACDAGVYRAVVTNAAGSVTTDPAAVSVEESLPEKLRRYRSAATAEPSIISYYGFDSLDASDAMGRYDGTPQGSAAFGDGIGGGAGKALVLDGAGHVGLGNPADFAFEDGDGTVEAWVRAGWMSCRYDPCLFSNRSSARHANWCIHVNADKGEIGDYDGTAFEKVGLFGVGDEWHHLALVFAGGRTRVFWDGSFLGEIPRGIGGVRGLPAQIGSSSADATMEGWIGAVDEVAFYADPLPPEAIAAHLAAFYRGDPPAIRIGPRGGAFLEGDSIALRAVTAGADLSHRWLKDGIALDRAAGPACSFDSLAAGDAGVYAVEVRNGAGTAMSGEASLSVVRANLDEYRKIVLAEPGLISFYSFEDGKASDAKRLHDGTAAGTCEFAKGIGNGSDRCLRLSGRGHVRLGPVADFEFREGHGTVEAWVRPDGRVFNGGPCIAACRDGDATAWSIHLRAAGDGVGVWNGSFFDQVVLSAPLEGWRHLAIAFGGGAWTLYLDGESKGTAPQALGAQADLPVQIGSSSATSTVEGWVGAIDEVAFYARTLDGSVILSHYRALTGSAAKDSSRSR